MGPNPVAAPPLRDSVPVPIGSRPLRRVRGKRGRYQVRRRDIQVPISPPEDAAERDETWSAMDWKKVFKELNDPNISVVKRRVRRIHLRWYHPTAQQMIRLLEMIGCPESTLKLTRDIVSACRVCRTWTRKAPDAKLAIRISIRFNQRVQVDLLFMSVSQHHLGAAHPPVHHLSTSSSTLWTNACVGPQHWGSHQECSGYP